MLCSRLQGSKGFLSGLICFEQTDAVCFHKKKKKKDLAPLFQGAEVRDTSVTLLKCAVAQRRRPVTFWGSDTVIEVQCHIDREACSVYTLDFSQFTVVVLNRTHSVNIFTDG